MSLESLGCLERLVPSKPSEPPEPTLTSNQRLRLHHSTLANGFDSVGKQIVIADSENKKSSSPYSYFFVQIRKFSPSPLLILPTGLSLYHKRNMLLE